jgi:hypothetical protein
MKAGGLDVVLLLYTKDEHMNVGVHLNQAPEGEQFNVYSMENLGVKYYVAECTGSFWRVGECPSDLRNASATIIPLANCEQVAPGEVSASFKTLEGTTLSMDVLPAFTIEGGTITVLGQIYPAVANQNVTLYVCAEGSPWTVLNITQTRSDGQFVYSWKSPLAGEVDVRASWTGNDQYAGTTSETKNAFVFPIYLIALIALAVIAVAACVTVFMLTVGKKPPSARPEGTAPPTETPATPQT